MSVTGLLLRWKHGYATVTDEDIAVTVNGEAVEIRGEALTVGAGAYTWGYLSLGSVETESEAKRIGGQELLKVKGTRDQISLGADPDPALPANAYGSGWNVGDYVLTLNRASVNEAARVLQVSITEDDNGAMSVLPDLSSLLEQYEVRTQRWLTRMADGTLNGSSLVASPIITPEWIPARRPGSTTQTFSWNPLQMTRTSPWTPEVAGRLAQMHMRRGRSNPAVASDIAGAVHVAFIVNGVTLDEGIIHDGYEEGVFGGSGVDFRPGDKLELQPTVVPAGTLNLTCRVIQTHYH